MKEKLIMWDDIELLDYIGNIERIYISDYDDYEYRDSFNVIKHYEGTEEFQRTLEEFTEEELRLIDLRPASATECTDIFTARYNDNLIKRKNIYSIYKKELGDKKSGKDAKKKSKSEKKKSKKKKDKDNED